jgi:acyl CoA:acetate/3-ketoacid CoA transferase alpha subunit
MEILESGLGEMIQPYDMDEFREWNRTQKSRKLVDKRMSEQEAVSRFVYDGCYIGTELYGTVRAPMSMAREVVRQNKKNLRVCGQGVLELDLWLAAGLIKKLDITYIGLEVYGIPPSLRRAVESGQVETCVEWSNASITWRMKAAAMGVPFLPARSMLGTDMLKYSAAKVVEDPFTGIKVALLPALVLDVQRADMYGNCQIEGITGFALEMSRACKRLIISTEEIVPNEEIRKYPDRTVIPYFLVDSVVHAPFGSFPGEMAYMYGRDEAGIKEWVDMSATAGGAQAYLDKYVHGVKDHAAYLDLVGKERLDQVVETRERRD